MSIAVRRSLVALVALGIGCAKGQTHTGDGGIIVGDGGVGDASATSTGPLTFTRLRTEYRVDPIGLDVAAPRLEWQLASTIRDEVQTSYRVLAASSATQLAADDGDLWDSGQVASAQSTQVVYAGRPLASRRPRPPATAATRSAPAATSSPPRPSSQPG